MGPRPTAPRPCPCRYPELSSSGAIGRDRCHGPAFALKQGPSRWCRYRRGPRDGRPGRSGTRSSLNRGLARRRHSRGVRRRPGMPDRRLKALGPLLLGLILYVLSLALSLGPAPRGAAVTLVAMVALSRGPVAARATGGVVGGVVVAVGGEALLTSVGGAIALTVVAVMVAAFQALTAFVQRNADGVARPPGQERDAVLAPLEAAEGDDVVLDANDELPRLLERFSPDTVTTFVAPVRSGNTLTALVELWRATPFDATEREEIARIVHATGRTEAILRVRRRALVRSHVGELPVRDAPRSEVLEAALEALRDELGVRAAAVKLHRWRLPGLDGRDGGLARTRGPSEPGVAARRRPDRRSSIGSWPRRPRTPVGIFCKSSWHSFRAPRREPCSCAATIRAAWNADGSADRRPDGVQGGRRPIGPGRGGRGAHAGRRRPRHVRGRATTWTPSSSGPAPTKRCTRPSACASRSPSRRRVVHQPGSRAGRVRARRRTAANGTMPAYEESGSPSTRSEAHDVRDARSGAQPGP